MTIGNLALVIPLVLQVAATGCASETVASAPGASRDVTVMCNSTVSHDTAACQVRANEACGRTARLTGVISSVEMTGKSTRQLYTITARYACTDA